MTTPHLTTPVDSVDGRNPFSAAIILLAPLLVGALLKVCF